MSNIDVPVIEVLHEDPHLLVVNKPAGLPVQPDLTGDPSLLDILAERYVVDAPMLVHRLDRPVSGAVLLARNRDSLAAMNAAFQDRSVGKVYWAIVTGSMEPSTLRHHAVKDKRRLKTRIVAKEDGERELVLHVACIATGDRYTLVELRPEGGAFHQIRAQLSAAGHPIKGDVKYGARRGERDRSIALHARSLEFIHPATERILKVHAPAPVDPVWRTLLGSATTGP